MKKKEENRERRGNVDIWMAEESVTMTPGRP